MRAGELVELLVQAGGGEGRFGQDRTVGADQGIEKPLLVVDDGREGHEILMAGSRS